MQIAARNLALQSKGPAGDLPSALEEAMEARNRAWIIGDPMTFRSRHPSRSGEHSKNTATLRQFAAVSYRAEVPV